MDSRDTYVEDTSKYISAEHRVKYGVFGEKYFVVCAGDVKIGQQYLEHVTNKFEKFERPES